MKEQLPRYIKHSPRSNGKEPIKKYMGFFKYKNEPFYCGSHETIKASKIAVDVKRLYLGLDAIILKKVIK